MRGWWWWCIDRFVGGGSLLVKLGGRFFLSFGRRFSIRFGSRYSTSGKEKQKGRAPASVVTLRKIIITLIQTKNFGSPVYFSL